MEKRRVGAILASNTEKLEFIGYGTYVGDYVPPKEISSLLNQLNFPNPKIILDNGDVVWGCECWWGSEQQIKKMVEEHQNVVHINMKDIRG